MSEMPSRHLDAEQAAGEIGDGRGKVCSHQGIGGI